MTTEAEIQQKSGANVNAAFNTAMMTASCLRAESLVNCLTRYNFSDTYTTLNADVKGILNDIVSSLVAIEAISYDMSGYTTRIEAEDMVNINKDIALRGIAILRDQKVVTFINGA